MIGIVLHGLSMVLLLRDERPIKFKTEDEEQLWRFFYRRSGMGRLEMVEVGRSGGGSRPLRTGEDARSAAGVPASACLAAYSAGKTPSLLL